MISKEQFLASVEMESSIVVHLISQVMPNAWDYRPTPGQRSTLELVQYLTISAIVPATFCVTGTWDHKQTLEAKAGSLTLSDFPNAMKSQAQALSLLLLPFHHADFSLRPSMLPWGVPSFLGIALVNTALKALVAYRMQLFLYAKSSGSTHLNSKDCWVA